MGLIFSSSSSLPFTVRPWAWLATVCFLAYFKTYCYLGTSLKSIIPLMPIRCPFSFALIYHIFQIFFSRKRRLVLTLCSLIEYYTRGIGLSQRLRPVVSRSKYIGEWIFRFNYQIVDSHLYSEKIEFQV